MISREEELRLLASASRRLNSMRRQEDFDPARPGSRPTTAQQEIIDDFGKVPVQWIVSGNRSGKSQLSSRLITWMMTDTHPSWARPSHWGTGPILAIVAARTGKQIEDSLAPKITSYLIPGSYKEVRLGNVLQRIEFTNGNRIIFQSLENAATARERLQGYTAHLVWVDEQPPAIDIVTELLMRVQTDRGYFFATFTPLVVNVDLQRLVDSATLPYSKRYRLTLLDNPLFADPERRVELMASFGGMSEAERNARLYGEWVSADDLVFHFDPKIMIRDLPVHYSRQGWRHVESVDPALSSALGYTLWAEDPQQGHWYNVHAEYLKGIRIPTLLVDEVRKRSAYCNIVRRISDPHEVWFTGTAFSHAQLRYTGVYNKNSAGRKGELIKGFQALLGTRAFLTPSNSLPLIEELQNCRWADRESGKIQNGPSYHLLDASQYFADNVPKFEGKPPAIPLYDQIWRLDDEKRAKIRVQEQKAEAQKDRAYQIVQRRREWTKRRA